MTIDTIRKNICHNVGNDIMITYNEGRNKISCYRGKIIEVYHSVFIIMDDDNKRSFSYCDILTKTVKVSFNCKKKCKIMEKY